MKFKCSVDINLPIDQVVLLFDNIENNKHWQDGFLRIESISGIPGELDSISKLYFKQGKGEMELTETILVKDLPNEQIGNYEHVHMDNLMTSRFSSISKDQTRWVVEIEYTKFKSFMPKMMAKLFPGIFKKPVQKWLIQFKNFAENK